MVSIPHPQIVLVFSLLLPGKPRIPLWFYADTVNLVINRALWFLHGILNFCLIISLMMDCCKPCWWWIVQSYSGWGGINAIHQALCVMVPKYFVFTPLNFFSRKILIGVGTTGVMRQSLFTSVALKSYFAMIFFYFRIYWQIKEIKKNDNEWRRKE